MSQSKRRYEILLPLTFNDGSPLPEALVEGAFLTLRSRFGGASVETQTIRGVWQHDGRLYRDGLARIFVDVDDLPEHRAWFIEFKEHLKRDFQQIDIWMTTHAIEVL